MGTGRWLVGSVLAIAGCGRSGLDLANEGAASRAGNESGGHAGSAGPAAGGATAGTATSGGSSGAGTGHSIVSCDHDGDGHRTLDCNGDDCDDSDPSVHPGAADTNAVAGQWRGEFVFGDIPGDVRGTPAIAVDSTGVAHVIAGRAGLRYANNALGWMSEMIDGSSMGAPSLAVSPDGSVNIAYVTEHEVRLATRTRQAWATERILTLNPGTPAYEGACSLAGDREGRLHLVFRGGGVLKYMTRADGAWSESASFSASNEVTPALALDPLGTPHFVFGASDGDQALLYATRCEPSFCLDRIRAGTALDADIALDAEGTVHVVYGMNMAGSELVHAVRANNGTWLEEVVAPSSSFGLDLEAGPQGGAAPLHLAFLGGGGSVFTVSYARREGDVWVTEQVAPHGYGVSLALEGANVAHIGRTDFRFDTNTFVGYSTNRELAPDQIDQNCDGVDGVDADRDGFAAVSTGGTDCDDGDASVHRLSSDGLGCDDAAE